MLDARAELVRLKAELATEIASGRHWYAEANFFRDGWREARHEIANALMKPVQDMTRAEFDAAYPPPPKLGEVEK